MTRNTRMTLALIAAVVLGVTGLLVVDRADRPAAPAAEGSVDPAVLVRADSHRLATAEDGVTLVEFLDFECEGCLAAYPAVQRILDTYQGQVTVVVRYFPMPGHPNSDLAAQAAQAAANQGRFAEMYARLFEGQPTWGHRQDPQTEVFVGYARTLGLDVERFRQDLTDPATAARIAADRADGEAAGVTGTPTFFVDGRPLTHLRTEADLVAAIDDALAG
ncbi:DsbA family protein [Micromonospora sp. SH-82]|uniref:DsbA family protein n=1 Tax=Micromonospora sp. SH-82 TaxID=3132938 RepID=UPI003EC01BD8